MSFSPHIPIILDVPHIEQRTSGECLVACAAMACEYKNISVKYKRLARTLNIAQGIGAPFYHIQNLKKLRIQVRYRELSTLAVLYNILSNDLPCLVSVQTYELSYWKKKNVSHAVLLVGMDQDFVYLNDPAFPTGPIQTPIGDFDLAWLAHDEKFAVISK